MASSQVFITPPDRKGEYCITVILDWVEVAYHCIEAHSWSGFFLVSQLKYSSFQLRFRGWVHCGGWRKGGGASTHPRGEKEKEEEEEHPSEEEEE